MEVNETRTPVSVVALFIGISIVASLFICWLVYYHAPSDVAGTQLAFLPTLIAAFNALSAVALCFGLGFIRAQNITAHRTSMFTAFVFSSLFLVCYLLNYEMHGETHFPGKGIVIWIYYPLLISHIILAAVALPMILITFFLSLTGRFPVHKKVARWTFPIWLYVSVTGVVVHLMLAIYR